jgi:phosphonate metabolism protein PhnN/1,5-bisphosphokinase (PRPP-forming)
MTGLWVFVVGPSGAGKDSVINCAQQLLTGQKNIVFSSRLVTRPSQAGSEHDPIPEQEFRLLMASGSLSWHWQAHGFSYGVAAHYETDVQAGRLVVVNGSRAHVNSVLSADDIKVVEVTASNDQLASRLQQRGRDDAQAITSRLARNASLRQVSADCLIVNNNTLATAGQQLADYLVATLQGITL